MTGPWKRGLGSMLQGDSRVLGQLAGVAVAILVMVNGEQALAKKYAIPAENFEEVLQERIARAQTGDIIVLPSGAFAVSRSITLVGSNISLRGRGSQRTRLSFRTQKSGAQSVLVMGEDIVIEGLAIVDPPADGLVSRRSRQVVLRDVTVEWTGAGPAERGGYGIYPIHSEKITIERCSVRGAREAGIYVGQSVDGRVRENRVEKNVVGIDIENSTRVLVENNEVRGNSVGIVVSARPNLFQPHSHQNRVVRNRIVGNNLTNFAATGSHLLQLGSGRGLMVFSSSETTVEKNRFEGHRSAHAVFLNYLSLERRIDPPDPFFMPDLIDTRLSGNRFSESSEGAIKPTGRWQDVEGAAVVWDGIRSAFPRAPEALPVPVCSTDKSDLLYLRTGEVSERDASISAVPRCAQIRESAEGPQGLREDVRSSEESTSRALD